MPTGIYKRTKEHNKNISEFRKGKTYEEIKKKYLEWHSLVVQGLVNGLSHTHRDGRIEDINFWKQRSILWNEFAMCVQDLMTNQDYKYSEENLKEYAKMGYQKTSQNKEERIIKLGDKIFTEDYGNDEVKNNEYDYAYKKWEKLKEQIENETSQNKDKMLSSKTIKSRAEKGKT